MKLRSFGAMSQVAGVAGPPRFSAASQAQSLVDPTPLLSHGITASPRVNFALLRGRCGSAVVPQYQYEVSLARVQM